jgi:hypothetical protein
VIERLIPRDLELIELRMKLRNGKISTSMLNRKFVRWNVLMKMRYSS